MTDLRKVLETPEVQEALGIFEAQDSRELGWCYQGGDEDAYKVATVLAKAVNAALAQSKGHVLLPVEDAEIILSGVAWGDDAATKRYFDAKDRLRVAMEGEKP